MADSDGEKERMKPSWERIMQDYSRGERKWRLARVPIIGPLLTRGRFKDEIESNWMIPVSEPIVRGESVALPSDVLIPILEKASFIFKINHCPCRDGYGCQSYPHEIGCLIMGPGARGIRPEFGKQVSVEDAVNHVQKAVKTGLVPLIVHSTTDSDMFGIDYDRMLAVCLCCDCCCDIRKGLRLGPRVFWENVHRLPGLTVSVGEACTLCGDCLEVCFRKDIIKLGRERAEISDLCVGCGKCALVCPVEAISFTIEGRERTTERLLAAIKCRTEI